VLRGTKWYVGNAPRRNGIAIVGACGSSAYTVAVRHIKARAAIHILCFMNGRES